MDMDEQHAQYFDKNPNGNHGTTPSAETLRFMSKTNQKFNYLQETLLSIKETLIEFKTKTEQGISTMHNKQDHTNGWIKEHEEMTGSHHREWDEYRPMLDEIKEERRDKKQRARDLLWNHGWKVAVALLLILSSIGGTDKIKEIIELIK
jgi:hypothetical protein